MIALSGAQSSAPSQIYNVTLVIDTSTMLCTSSLFANRGAIFDDNLTVMFSLSCKILNFHLQSSYGF